MSVFKQRGDKDIGIREFLERVIDERDRLYDARFRAAEIAVAAAFDAQKEAVAAAFLASKEAIGKAENAQTAYNVAHNDLARKMDEQNKATMPRPETTALFEAVNAKLVVAQSNYDSKLEALRASFEKDTDNLTNEIAGLRESRSTAQGAKMGSRDLWGVLIGGIGSVVGVVSVILLIIYHK